MQRASQRSEKAFDQAGQPDIAAATWDRLMAMVLEFAES
jgi:hypothetical protein